MHWLRKLWSPRRRIQVLVALPLLWFAAGAVSAWVATMPWPKPIPPRTELAGRAVTDVAVTTAGLVVRGWLVRAEAASTRCVVLVAGVRGNRLAMVERAEWYLAAGWSTLLVDLRGTGASDRARISMGFHEADDLLAWRSWLRTQGFTCIGAHGQSLGAAAIVYGAARNGSDAGWDFAVLESCYGDIESALHNRLPWLPLPGLCLWPLRLCAEWFMQADGERMRPLAAIRELRAPTLIACGDGDSAVGKGVSEELLEACGAASKQYVCLPRAGHVDLWRTGASLPAALSGFLATVSR